MRVSSEDDDDDHDVKLLLKTTLDGIVVEAYDAEGKHTTVRRFWYVISLSKSLVCSSAEHRCNFISLVAQVSEPMA